MSTDRPDLRLDRVDGVEPVATIAEGFAAQSRRLVDLFTSFDVDRWDRPTRCSDWTAHETFRHMADVLQLHCAFAHGEDPPLPISDGFDPNRTPDLWLRLSVDEAPGETIQRYGTAAGRLVELERRRSEEGSAELGLAPYGPVHWSLATSHILWDAWLHERDILLPLGVTPEVGAAEATLARCYGFFLALVAVGGSEGPFAATVTGSQWAEPAVRLQRTDEVIRVVTGSSVRGDAPHLRASGGATVDDVVDALGGRGRAVSGVLAGESAAIARLSSMAELLASDGTDRADPPGDETTRD